MTTQAPAAPIGERSPRMLLAGLSETRVVALALAVVVALQFSLVFTRSINWDEFWFYHLILQFNAGELTMPLQTLHVRLFSWLPALAGSGVDHIVFARIFMFACELVTIGAIVAIARRFVEMPAAIAAGLLYVSAGFVFQHGFSFRTDPMATAALMVSLALIARRPLDLVTIVSVALLIAVASLVTTKVILYIPAFAGLAWLNLVRSGYKFSYMLRCAILVAVTAALFTLLYNWHVTGLQPAAKSVAGAGEGAGEIGGGSEMLAGAAKWMFFVGLPPYLDMISKAMLTAPMLTLLSWAAPFVILLGKRPVAEKVALLGFWAIIFVPLFYKNTAGYFYVFMFAPLAVGCIDSITLVHRRYGAHLPAIMLLGIAVGVFAMERRDVIGNQRELQEAAHVLFDRPVAYFDHNGMLPGFDKKNYLMTPSGMTAYREAGIPAYRNAMQQDAIPLLLSNWFSLRITLLTDDDSLLLPEDLKAIRENYIPFYGPFWLAGREIEAKSTYADELLVPGEYTVLNGPAVIDGRRLEPGSVVMLERGIHEWSAPETDSRVVWGADRKDPAKPWVDGPLYVGF